MSRIEKPFETGHGSVGRNTFLSQKGTDDKATFNPV